MNIKRCADCGNSPKNKFAEDLAVALFGGDGPDASARMSADVALDIVGLFRASGRADVLSRLGAADALDITTVVTHGRAGCVSGTATRGERSVRFAIVLRFASAKGDAVQHIEFYSPEPELLWRTS